MSASIVVINTPQKVKDVKNGEQRNKQKNEKVTDERIDQDVFLHTVLRLGVH